MPFFSSASRPTGHVALTSNLKSKHTLNPHLTPYLRSLPPCAPIGWTHLSIVSRRNSHYLAANIHFFHDPCLLRSWYSFSFILDRSSFSLDHSSFSRDRSSFSRDRSSFSLLKGLHSSLRRPMLVKGAPAHILVRHHGYEAVLALAYALLHFQRSQESGSMQLIGKRRSYMRLPVSDPQTCSQTDVSQSVYESV